METRTNVSLTQTPKDKPGTGVDFDDSREGADERSTDDDVGYDSESSDRVLRAPVVSPEATDLPGSDISDEERVLSDDDALDAGQLGAESETAELDVFESGLTAAHLEAAYMESIGDKPFHLHHSTPSSQKFLLSAFTIGGESVLATTADSVEVRVFGSKNIKVVFLTGDWQYQLQSSWHDIADLHLDQDAGKIHLDMVMVPVFSIGPKKKKMGVAQDFSKKACVSGLGRWTWELPSEADDTVWQRLSTMLRTCPRLKTKLEDGGFPSAPRYSHDDLCRSGIQYKMEHKASSSSDYEVMPVNRSGVSVMSTVTGLQTKDKFNLQCAFCDFKFTTDDFDDDDFNHHECFSQKKMPGKPTAEAEKKKKPLVLQTHRPFI